MFIATRDQLLDDPGLRIIKPLGDGGALVCDRRIGDDGRPRTPRLGQVVTQQERRAELLAELREWMEDFQNTIAKLRQIRRMADRLRRCAVTHPRLPTQTVEIHVDTAGASLIG